MYYCPEGSMSLLVNKNYLLLEQFEVVANLRGIFFEIFWLGSVQPLNFA